MANRDRWRDRDDRFRDDDYRRRSRSRGGGNYGGEWERAGVYGRDRDFEGGYGTSDYERGRDYLGYGGGGFEAGYRGGTGYRGGGYGGSGESGFEYRGSGYGRDFEGSWRGSHGSSSRGDFERGGDRGGGGYGASGAGFGSYGDRSSFGRNYGRDWRDYGAENYPGIRDRGTDWNRDFGREDYGRGGYGADEERGFWERAADEVSSWFGDEDAERRRRMDHYRGRGPKGYTRSDDRIREDVSDRLTDDWRVDASEIDVSVSGGEVTLSGTVNSRDAKRRAEDLAENVSGVKHVQNNIRVSQASWAGGSSGTTGTAGSTGGTGTSVSQSTTGTRTR
jgi:osmotically-inducible protein OsmY